MSDSTEILKYCDGKQAQNIIEIENNQFATIAKAYIFAVRFGSDDEKSENTGVKK